jgi:hypothetical protein
MAHRLMHKLDSLINKQGVAFSNSFAGFTRRAATPPSPPTQGAREEALRTALWSLTPLRLPHQRHQLQHEQKPTL